MATASESYITSPPRTYGFELSNAERARRRALSIEARFPVLVRGVDASGRRFECDAVLEQLSACCLGIRMRRRLRPGAGLFVFIRFASAPSIPAPRVAVHGWVVDTQTRAEGLWAVTAEFAHHRFIYTPDDRRKVS